MSIISDLNRINDTFDNIKVNLAKKSSDYSDIILSDIPDAIYNLPQSEYDVDEILSDIISGSPYIKKLPNNITVLDNTIFGIDSSIKYVLIPRTIHEIKSQSFSMCSGIKLMYLPDTIDVIEANSLPQGSNIKFLCQPTSKPSGWNDSRLESEQNTIWNVAYKSNDTFNYLNVNNSYIILLDYIGYSKEVLIPEYIDELPVKQLLGTFYNKSYVKSVTISSDLDYIASYSFYKCDKLEKLNLNVRIGEFENDFVTECSNIKYLNIKLKYLINFIDNIKPIDINIYSDSQDMLPDNFLSDPSKNTYISNVKIYGYLNSIGNNVFNYCRNLNELKLPESISEIGDNFLNKSIVKSLTVFSGFTFGLNFLLGTEIETLNYRGTLSEYLNTNFTNIINTKYIYIDGYLYDPDNLGILKIPNDITEIKSFAMSSIPVRSVIFPQSVTKINSYAFKDNHHVKILNIPDTITSIEDSSFSGCSSLTSVTFEEGSQLTSIGDYAFYNCSRLTSITIPEGVTSIGEDAFKNCSRLTSITIPNSVTSIGKGAFSGCSSLESITLPFIGAKAGVTSNDTYQYPLGYIFGTDNYSNSYSINQTYYEENLDVTVSKKFYIPRSLLKVVIRGGNILYGAFDKFKGNVFIKSSVKSIASRALNLYLITGNVFYELSERPESYATQLSGVAEYWDINDVIITDYYEYAIHNNIDTCILIRYHSNENIINLPRYLDSYKIVEIGTSSFLDLPAEKIYIDYSVSQIDEGSFRNCNNLLELYLPASIEKVTGWMALNCPNLHIYCELKSSRYPNWNNNWNNDRYPVTYKYNNITSNDNYDYVVDPETGEAYLTDYKGELSEDFILPDTIDGYKIISISDSLGSRFTAGVEPLYFKFSKHITTIAYPINLTVISKLEAIVVPSNVTKIYKSALFEINYKVKVFYEGSEEDWSNIEIGSNNSKFTDASRYYYSDSQPSESNKYWHYVDGIPTIWTV